MPATLRIQQQKSKFSIQWFILPFIKTLLLCSFLIFSNLSLAENKTLNVGLIIFSPESHLISGQICAGRAVDEVKSIFRESKFNLSIKCAPPARIYRDFLKGDIDLTINIKSTSSISDQAIYSDKPYANLNIVLYKNTNKNDKRIAAINKYEYHGARHLLKAQDYRFINKANTKEAVAVFFRGGTGSLISYKGPFEAFLKSEDTSPIIKDSTMIYEEHLLVSVPTFYALHKEYAHVKETLAIINKFNNNK